MSVYFLQRSDGLVKIGYTGDPKVRFYSISLKHGVVTPLALINGDRSIEKALHIQFAEDRVEGEWFKLSNALVSYIKGCQQLPIPDAKSRIKEKVKRPAVKSSGRLIMRLQELLAEKEIREKKRYTLREIAKQAGVSPNVISRWMRGMDIEKATIATVKKVAKWLDCTIDELVVLVRDEPAA